MDEEESSGKVHTQKKKKKKEGRIPYSPCSTSTTSTKFLLLKRTLN